MSGFLCLCVDVRGAAEHEGRERERQSAPACGADAEVMRHRIEPRGLDLLMPPKPKLRV